MSYLCGIDEAGRGPVIGPLVMCGIIIPSKDKSKLKKLGIKDSKLISPKKRDELFEILKNYKHKVIVCDNDEVDKEVNDEDSSLNNLEAKKQAEIIDELENEIVIVDCPSISPTNYTKQLLSHVKTKKSKIICENKADLNYLEVSCASIIAKVTRDRIIDELKNKYGDFGSGYPSDPKTKKFVFENCRKLDIFRTTWKTYKNAIEETKQKSLEDF